jgi:hypothetical protein
MCPLRSHRPAVGFPHQCVAYGKSIPSACNWHSGERNFQREVMARALGEIQQEIEDRNKQAIDTALAGVRASIEALRQEITKRETIDTGAIVELPNPLARHDAA